MGSLLSHVVRLMLWLVLSVLLSSCLSESDEPAAAQNTPLVAFSFPPASTFLSTDGDSFDLSGLVIANASDAVVTELSFDLLSFSLANPDVIPDPQSVGTQLNNDSKPFFNWRQNLASNMLGLGLGDNTVAVTASFGNVTDELLATQDITRGTGYEWQSAVQLDPTDSDKAYILDAAQKMLVFVDVSGEEETDSNSDGMVQGDKLSVGITTMDSSVLVEPVDFAFISDTALLIVDAAQATVFKLELTINRVSMSNVIESVTGDLSTLSSPTDPDAVAAFNYPVAITTDRLTAMAATYAYVADQDSGKIIRVDVATGARAILTSDSIPDDHEPLLELPNDLVFHQYVNESMVTINELLVINAYREIIAVNVAGGARTLLDSPLDALDNAEVVEETNFGVIKSLALADDVDKLYVSAVDLFGVIEVDLSSGSEDIEDADGNVLEAGVLLRGRRDLISGAATIGNVILSVPNSDNAFFNPGALIYDRDHVDSMMMPQPRLLVLDNERGSIMAVNLDEPAPETTEPSIGARTFLAGGLTQEDDDSSLDVSPLAPPVFLTKIITPTDLIVNGSSLNSLLTLDKAVNGAVVVSLLGSSDRTFIGQAASLNTDDELDEVETEKRRFIDPRKIQYSSSSNLFYVVDAATDTVFSSLNDRTIRSKADVMVPLNDPRGLVVYDADSEDDEEQLFIINADDTGNAELVSITVDDDPDSDDMRTPLTLSCSIIDPVAMVLHNIDPDKPRLVIVNQLGVVYVVDIIVDNVGDFGADCQDTSGVNSLAGTDIIDMEIDPRNTTSDSIDLLLLDKTDKNVYLARVVTTMPTNLNVDPIFSGVRSNGGMGANVFISPDSMVFNAQFEILYVLDSTIRSLYMVDLASRDADGASNRTGEVDPSHTVSGQRFVISRGAPLSE